jgi:hypothetical protein
MPDGTKDGRENPGCEISPNTTANRHQPPEF